MGLGGETLNLVERKRSRPIGGLGDGGATGSRIGRSCVKNKTGDESSKEVANVEKSSTSSKF